MASSNTITLQALRCNSCGAPLSVPRTANFVTCNHCRTHLAIHRTPTISYTRALSRIAQRTDQLAEQVRYLTWRNAIDALDREWEREKEKHLYVDKYGRRCAPDRSRAFIIALLVAVPGILMLVAGLFAAALGPVASGLAILALGVHAARRECDRARAYERARHLYVLRRSSLTPESVRVRAPRPHGSRISR